ncbi:hypothetical protein G5C51_35885 [Streptomyces sp. A7024]|uniref:Uncharacterized protein n=2 Tax=Streptomyces coryli TaxID=1128680 RepID=A0A6G4UAI5_9ACTN|nr:hypothetical protein [Streptomyces coryli]
MLTDTGVQSALPGTAVLRLETTSNRTGTLDGAWWPRSRGIEGELPTLLTALTARLGPLARVGLDASAWDDAPRHVDVDGHSVRIDWSAVGDNTMIITRGRHDHFALLVIPPQAGTEAARAAMSMAVQPGQPMSAEHILTASGLSSRPSPTPPPPLSAPGMPA